MTTLDRVRVPAELHRLAGVRDFVRRGATDAGASGECIDELVQAVDEAATNAIVHGYAGVPGWVEVALTHDAERCLVTLEDEAPVFDPTTVPEPDMTIPPGRRQPGGMGVHLIRLAVDDMAHRPRPGGGNILTLARSLGTRRKEDQ
jgi:serine/threonine-protein kinase RsbW